MPKKMLIDATHPEETRVVVADGARVEDFDFESASRRQLAGNIYLARVTRVEPSLQAAFIEYGGNRHGFLAFAEIHPDYYQIPVADRQALIAEERALAQGGDEEAEAEEEGGRRPRRPRRGRASERGGDAVARGEPEAGPTDAEEPGEDGAEDEDDEGLSPASDEGLSPMATVADTPVDTPAGDDAGVEVVDKDDTIETVAEEEDALDLAPPRRPRARRYKIQEVVKVRQIMLVQVVKEERGNKGAALTTYLSLAGRYCVLMPNTARGGGISRKIVNPADRKKLKEIAGTMDVPEGAGLIIRTAGSERSGPEIRRDYEYLQRLWEQIRELTLKSIAPAKIYEEGDIIKRSIRDLYAGDIDEVVVAGAEGYRNARDFMRMILPAQAREVVPYNDTLPLFARHGVESTLASMFNPTVQLPSGGYIVIGVTEALVAIDVNSGRATKEGSIEQTALKTNLEASDEIARQLRLRDLAGLIVVDYIDMDERKNNAAVEKRFKDKLKTDRARIQVGRISGFGLLEMSRQRMRPGMLEATTQPCPHCHGTGLLRSDDNVALAILRQLEEEGTRGRSKEVLVRAPVGIANFLMNGKREHVTGIEQRYGMSVRVEADTSLVSPDFAVEKFRTATRAVPEPLAVVMAGSAELMPEEEEVEDVSEVEDEVEALSADAAPEATAPEAEPVAAEGDDRPRKRRRRRRRRGPRDEAGVEVTADGVEEGDEEDDAEEPVEEPAAAEPVAGPIAEPEPEAPVAAEAEPAEAPARRTRTRSRKVAPAEAAPEPEAVPEPAPKRRGRARKADAAEGASVEAPEADAPKPARARRARAGAAAVAPLPTPVDPDDPVQVAVALDDDPALDATPPVPDAPEAAREEADRLFEPADAPAEPEPEAAASEAEPQADKPKRRGWWSAGR